MYPYVFAFSAPNGSLSYVDIFGQRIVNDQLNHPPIVWLEDYKESLSLLLSLIITASTKWTFAHHLYNLHSLVHIFSCLDIIKVPAGICLLLLYFQRNWEATIYEFKSNIWLYQLGNIRQSSLYFPFIPRKIRITTIAISMVLETVLSLK